MCEISTRASVRERLGQDFQFASFFFAPLAFKEALENVWGLFKKCLASRAFVATAAFVLLFGIVYFFCDFSFLWKLSKKKKKSQVVNLLFYSVYLTVYWLT